MFGPFGGQGEGEHLSSLARNCWGKISTLCGLSKPAGGARTDCLSRNILCSPRFTTPRPSPPPWEGAGEFYNLRVITNHRYQVHPSNPSGRPDPPDGRDLITKCHQLRLSITFHFTTLITVNTAPISSNYISLWCWQSNINMPSSSKN